MNKQKAIEQLDRLIKEGNDVLNTQHAGQALYSGTTTYVDTNKFQTWKENINIFLSLDKATSTSYDSFKNIKANAFIHTNFDIAKQYLNVLSALKSNIENDIIEFKEAKTNTELNHLPSINNSGSGNVIVTAQSENSNIQINQELSKFDEIEKVITHTKELENKELLLQILTELKNSTNDKNKFLDNYNKLVANLANHATILTPFMYYLSQFLPH